IRTPAITAARIRRLQSARLTSRRARIGAGTATVPVAARRAAPSSAAEAYRSAGDLASALRTTWSRAGVTPSRTTVSERTGSVRTRVRTARGVGPVWGVSPLSISYNTQPSEYTSVR